MLDPAHMSVLLFYLHDFISDSCVGVSEHTYTFPSSLIFVHIYHYIYIYLSLYLYLLTQTISLYLYLLTQTININIVIATNYRALVRKTIYKDPLIIGPLIIGLLCGKRSTKIRHPTHLRHPVGRFVPRDHLSWVGRCRTSCTYRIHAVNIPVCPLFLLHAFVGNRMHVHLHTEIDLVSK